MTRDEIQKIIDSLTIDQKIGQLCMAGICGGESLDFARSNFEKYHFGGLMFSANFQRFIRAADFLPCGCCRNEPIEKVARFLYDIHAASLEVDNLPVIIGGDQEGGMSGSVLRRRQTTIMPPQMALAASPQASSDAYQAAAVAAAEVKAIGMDMLYGPVMDVNVNPDNPEVGARSFGDDPATACELGPEFIRAFAENNVISTAKHFPGRGRGKVDAHHVLETIDVDRKTLDEFDTLPFRRAIAAGVEAVMVCHTIFPALDPGWPASLSRRAVTDYLRGELGFDGLVIPDTLTMWAISKNYDVPRACAMVLEAGADMFFMKDPPRYDLAFQAVKDSLLAGRLTEDRLNQSLHRVLALKAKHGLWELGEFSTRHVTETVGTAENHRKAREIAGRTLVELKNDSLLPFADRSAPVLAVVPRDMGVIQANDPVHNHQMLPDALARHFDVVDHVLLDLAVTEHQAFEAVSRARNAELVVFGVFTGTLPEGMARVLDDILALGKDVAVVVANTPYVFKALPAGIRAAVCCFAVGPAQFDAVADYIAGKAQAPGKLSVKM